MTDEDMRKYRRRETIQLLKCIEVQARVVREAFEENRVEPELTDFGVLKIVSDMSDNLRVFQNFTNPAEETE